MSFDVVNDDDEKTTEKIISEEIINTSNNISEKIFKKNANIIFSNSITYLY